MSRELDVQLLETVAVRRARLRASSVWGRDRRVRASVDDLERLADVTSAGCVGRSFVQDLPAEQARQQTSAVLRP